MWRRQMVWWHGFFAALVAATLILVVAESKPQLGWQVGCVLAIAAAYAVWGRRGLGEQDPRSARIYLGLAWVLMVVLIGIDSTGTSWVLTFGLFSQTWASLPRNQAAGAAVTAILGLAVVRIWTGARTVDELVGVGTSTVITLALSLTLGFFVHRLIDEADTRARVIDELHRTQAELAAAERARGRLTERERLSREIHDTLAQGFTSVVTLARAADAALDRGDEAAVRERLALLEKTAAENLAEARIIVAELTPGHLQGGTLAEALQRVVDRAASESGIKGSLRVEGTPVASSANAEVVLLRTAQEGLANIRRHSGARCFEVVLSYAHDDQVGLEVTDDGSGFDPAAASAGYGLVGARSRATDLGSELVVDSAPGRGTSVRVSVPR